MEFYDKSTNSGAETDDDSDWIVCLTCEPRLEVDILQSSQLMRVDDDLLILLYNINVFFRIINIKALE
jgi:hypothetical protein